MLNEVKIRVYIAQKMFYKADILDDQYISSVKQYSEDIPASLDKDLKGMRVEVLVLSGVPKVSDSVIMAVYEPKKFRELLYNFAITLKSAKIKTGRPMITIDDGLPF